MIQRQQLHLEKLNLSTMNDLNICGHNLKYMYIYPCYKGDNFNMKDKFHHTVI